MQSKWRGQLKHKMQQQQQQQAMVDYKQREELVGKRFMSCSGYLTDLSQEDIANWGWRSGFIRAASHLDNDNEELQVLVEYDDMIWQRREWISIHQEGLFKVFMVESTLVWCCRLDPNDTRNKSCIAWPGLSFVALVDRVGLDESKPKPIEYLVDREITFRVYSRLKPFHEWDPGTDPGGLSDPQLGPCVGKDACAAYPAVRSCVRRWEEVQDGYRILLATPSVLVGYRVEVYRSEGTTQWYTAVIVGYDENSGEITVTDDTVLEEHTEHPKLTQIRLIGDVVDSIMRGETLQRRSSRHQTSQSPPSPPPPARFQQLLLQQQQDGTGSSSSSTNSRRRGSRQSTATASTPRATPSPTSASAAQAAITMTTTTTTTTTVTATSSTTSLTAVVAVAATTPPSTTSASPSSTPATASTASSASPTSETAASVIPNHIDEESGESFIERAES